MHLVWLHTALPIQAASEVVGLLSWNTTSRFLRSYIVMNRENILACRHIPSHHGYLEELKLFSIHHRPINLANKPSDRIV